MVSFLVLIFKVNSINQPNFIYIALLVQLMCSTKCFTVSAGLEKVQRPREIHVHASRTILIKARMVLMVLMSESEVSGINEVVFLLMWSDVVEMLRFSVSN